MQLKMTTDYAIRLMICLARHGYGRVVTVGEIAKQIGVSPNYLKKAALNLRQNKLIRSEQGQFGGFALAKDPKDVTLYEVIATSERTVKLNRCLEADGHCGLNATEHCKVHKALGGLQQEFEAGLQSIKLADLI